MGYLSVLESPLRICHMSPRLPRLLLLAPLILALQACCSEHPRAALSTPPDRECQTGVEAGFDIALWECINEEHVIAYRTSSAFGGCSGVTVERAPCGELTPFERTHTGGTRSICGSP
jgi:hypothetical protein